MWDAPQGYYSAASRTFFPFLPFRVFHRLASCGGDGKRNYPVGKPRRALRFSRFSRSRKRAGSIFIKADNARSGVNGDSERGFIRCMVQVLRPKVFAAAP